MVNKAPWPLVACSHCGTGDLSMKDAVLWDGKPVHFQCAMALKKAYEEKEAEEVKK